MSGDISTFPSPKFSKTFPQASYEGLTPQQYAAVTRLTKRVTGVREVISGSADLTIDASAGSDFFTWLDGNRTVNEPLNPADLKQIRLWVTQDSTGSRTLTWNAVFRFSTDIPAPTLTTTGGYTDMIEFIYNQYYNTWDCIRVVKGYEEPAI